ncbi:hypothetical protein GCM10007862_31710 [Dyella lipolytica]|uniref:DUF3667 domain-containing protein n=1 Tax=Dyella lipolytica TaxID=1867835 RepID=A0ABW8IWB9_9GAMM|nr:DUF3667 domain-containing protein [Dyella lipolytica]GLQ48120.1 hypothetical protein GCM10007862_31710 [Dyella lipolytica]
MKELTSFEGVHCANCSTPLEGEYCHHCGQSVHSVLRPVHGLFEEFFETFLHIDGRILHTLPPLLLKPGFLTLEYFSGRRVRYIAPFRLMFVLCLMSFFVMHLAANVIAHRIEQKHAHVVLLDNGNDFAQAQTPKQVNDLLERKLSGLDAARQLGNPNVVTQVDNAERKLREQANDRLTQLGAAPANASTAPGKPSGLAQNDDSDMDMPVPQVQISWLPDIAKQRLTELFQGIRDNIQTYRHGSPTARQEAEQRMITGVFGALPGTMLVLIPVFALLLALVYLFKRRLYMEHLIVALHSHAFLFLSLLLIFLAGMLSTWLKPHAAWVGYAMGVIQAPLMIWIPTYLLIMQKRIYRQGWVMTLVKFFFIAWCYCWLLGYALLIAAVLGMAH